jgi:hypothetical protein
MKMSRIRIKNFGPIKVGNQSNDGWIDIKKVTVFIGNQGAERTVGKHNKVTYRKSRPFQISL